MANQNWAESLWKTYFEERVRYKVLDLGRIRKTREAFFHGMHCGTDLVTKAISKMTDQQAIDFIRELKAQITAGIKSDGSEVMRIDMRTGVNGE